MSASCMKEFLQLGGCFRAALDPIGVTDCVIKSSDLILCVKLAKLFVFFSCENAA